MGEAVVITAQQTEVGDLGLPTLGPGDKVVDIAPARRAVTARPETMPIAGDHRPAKTGGDDPGLAAHIEYLRASPEDDPGKRAVTAEGPEGIGVEHRSPLGLVETTQLLQGIKIKVEVEMGSFPTHGRGLGAVEKASSQVL
jgi:hypothetical protein